MACEGNAQTGAHCQMEPEDIAVLLFPSGTTSLPALAATIEPSGEKAIPVAIIADSGPVGSSNSIRQLGNSIQAIRMPSATFSS